MDLVVWQKGHKLVLAVYRATESFPRAEIFSLTNQIRRCAISITSNIAEGFGRSSSKEKLQFYAISRGSIFELQNQLLIARDIGFLERNIFDALAEETIQVSKILSGLMKSVRNNI